MSDTFWIQFFQFLGAVFSGVMAFYVFRMKLQQNANAAKLDNIETKSEHAVERIEEVAVIKKNALEVANKLAETVKNTDGKIDDIAGMLDELHQTVTNGNASEFGKEKAKEASDSFRARGKVT